MSEELTELQRETIRAILEGNTTHGELARRLSITRGAVHLRLAKIHGKIGATNTADVVLWAWRNGWTLP